VAEDLYATLSTSEGDIRVQLFPNHAPKTVRNQLSSLLTKLGVPDRPAAAALARRAGLGRDDGLG